MGLRLKDDVELDYDEANQTFSIEDLNTAQQFEFNSDGSTSIEPAAHSGTHESGGADTLDLGSLDVLSDLDLTGNAVTDSTGDVTLGSPLDVPGLTNSTGPVEVLPGNDVRLATGQAIEDGSGTNRIRFLSDRTDLIDEDASFDESITLQNGSGTTIRTLNGLTLRDEDQGTNAVQYDTDSSLGTLSLPNASLDLSEHNITNLSTLNWRDRTGDGDNWNIALLPGGVQAWRYGTANQLTLIENDRIEIEGGIDLRLATGQSIEDGGGAERLEFNSATTRVKNEAGNTALSLNEGGSTRLVATGSTPVDIFDLNGGFTAVEYTTSASAPGELFAGNAIVVAGANGSYEGGSNTGLVVDASGSTSSQFLVMANSNQNNAKLRNNNGELVGYDSGGNTTTLT